jgi:hypothetical protein
VAAKHLLELAIFMEILVEERAHRIARSSTKECTAHRGVPACCRVSNVAGLFSVNCTQLTKDPRVWHQEAAILKHPALLGTVEFAVPKVFAILILTALCLAVSFIEVLFSSLQFYPCHLLFFANEVPLHNEKGTRNEAVSSTDGHLGHAFCSDRWVGAPSLRDALAWMKPKVIFQLLRLGIIQDQSFHSLRRRLSGLIILLVVLRR